MKVLTITNMYPSKKDASFGIFVKKTLDALKKNNIQLDIVANKIRKKRIILHSSQIHSL